MISRVFSDKNARRRQTQFMKDTSRVRLSPTYCIDYIEPDLLGQRASFALAY
jgi:hypothetical protein